MYLIQQRETETWRQLNVSYRIITYLYHKLWYNPVKHRSTKAQWLIADWRYAMVALAQGFEICYRPWSNITEQTEHYTLWLDIHLAVIADHHIEEYLIRDECWVPVWLLLTLNGG